MYIIRSLYSMIPQQLKQMFGLTDQKDVAMANNIWKMLDDMSESNPQEYQQFVQKNMKEGIQDVKKKQDEQNQPYKIKPKIGVCLNMSATLSQKPLENSLNQKVLVTEKPWADVKCKFPASINITFNITHSDRIRDLSSKKSQKSISKFELSQLQDIEYFYYSLQGPLAKDKEGTSFDYCMIVGSRLFEDLMSQNGGKKILMGLCVSYLQQRLGMDKNPLLKHYNPDQYKRLAYYNIEKYSMVISEKPFKYGDSTESIEFLLERQVDKKRLDEEKKAKEKKEKQIKAQKPEILYKQSKKEEPEISSIKLATESSPASKKKPLIEVLKQEDHQADNEISYTMKQSEVGYSFQFLLPGVTSIKDVDLQMKPDCVKLKSAGKRELLIPLKRPINEETITAKFKKAQKMLKLDVKFI